MKLETRDSGSNPRAEHQRDWGHYVVLYEHPGIKIKTLFINQDWAIPSQFHLYHDEHWQIIAGRGIVRLGKGDEAVRFPVEPGVIVDIPAGRIHAIENIGTEPLVFLETQVALIIPGADANMADG